MPLTETTLTRKVRPYPFLPDGEAERAERWREILAIQTNALKRRLEVCHARPVLNVSGGLDSTLTLIVCAETLKLMGRPVSELICITSPCFGTSSRTRSNAETLCRGIGADFRVVNISESVKLHLRDIGHNGEKDSAYENAQARERTQVAMDIANMTGGIMVGTGDMSELALGWTTFNGDQMSMYSVNAGVPKSIMRYIIRYYADTKCTEAVRDALYDVCDTPVSPELIPGENGEIQQKTEDINGPYDIHDFILYYLVRYGFTPLKIFDLASRAFKGIYDERTIRRTFGVFYSRFTTQQFKRSCGADSPKIGSVSVVPQSGWRAPSDVSPELWKKQVAEITDG